MEFIIRKLKLQNLKPQFLTVGNLVYVTSTYSMNTLYSIPFLEPSPYLFLENKKTAGVKCIKTTQLNVLLHVS